MSFAYLHYEEIIESHKLTSSYLCCSSNYITPAFRQYDTGN